MKKALLCLLCLCLLSGAALMPALGEEEDEDVLIEEVIEDWDASIAEWEEAQEASLWTFPVPLEDLNPEYIVLANKHYLLSSDYVPPDLVKVPSKPASGGIRWAVQPKGGQQLRKECSEALCEMNAAMQEIDGFRTMYLKSAFRSYRTQKTMYSNRLAKNNGRDDGWVSMPGASDHQTGLGCDVVRKVPSFRPVQ